MKQPSYQDWLSEFLPHLREIYHIILRRRKQVPENKVSTLNFEEFCQLGYQTHGLRRIF